MSERAEELRSVDDDERATRDPDPAYLTPEYVGTRLRAPRKPLLLLPQRLSELTGPAFGADDVSARDADLTQQHEGEPLGERIIVSGRILGSDGRPVRGALIEIWQANAAGRYRHHVDQHPAPLDPNFTGGGRVLTDDDGRYRFITIKPGAYPWRNHDNAWRPAHIHLSIFGRAFTERLVTQMYFPGDPLFAYDPIYQSVRDPAARERMISSFDLASTKPEWALAYSFDVVLGGAAATPLEDEMNSNRTPSQTVGQFFEFGLATRPEVVPAGSAGAIALAGQVLDGAGVPVPDGLIEIWGADAAGSYEAGAWGRCQTAPDGGFAFTTVKPGAVRDDDGSVEAPHINVLCFARGLLKPVLTRVYFPDEAGANAADPVLGALAAAERATLIAAADGAAAYRFDIHLQGDGQTVFFTTPAFGL